MKEPRHRPNPAFDKAADADEHKRQQRIAALTDAQRQDYKELETGHRAKVRSTRNALAREHAQKLPDRMRAHLTPEPQPHLKLREADKAPDDRQLKRMRHSVDNYLAGKKTRDTNAFALQLQNAEKKTKGEFRRETKTTLDTLRKDHQKERDQFLQHCEKDLSREKTKNAFNENAKDATWFRAVQMATTHEADRDRDRQISKQFEKSR